MGKIKSENQGDLLHKISLRGLFFTIYPSKVARAFLISSLFILILGVMVSAGDITIKQGDLSVTGDLNMSEADSAIKIYADEHDIFNEGNSIELYALKGESKPYIAWYNVSGDGVGWLGCHYNLSNGDVHEHCSFETQMNDGMNTRFEIGYGGPVADNFVRVSSVGDFILGSGVDLQLTGGGSDIESSDSIDLYPWNQATIAFRVSNNSAGDELLLSGTGTNVIEIGDNLNMLDRNITNIQQVGIGELAPQGLLEITSDRDVLPGISTNSRYSLILRSDRNTNNEGTGLAFGRSSGGALGAAIIHERTGSSSDGDLIFATKSGTLTEAMRLYAGGNLAVQQNVTSNYASFTGGLTVGDGSEQKNITLYSPDNTAWNCGVDNSGAFSCS